MKVSTNHAVIILLLLVIVYLKNCTHLPPISPTTVTVTEVKWDTVNIPSIKYVPKWKDKIVYRTDTLFQPPIDTSLVLEDYYSSYYYQDTVHLDTIGRIVIKDTVSQNKITSRTVEPTINLPTVFVTTTEYINQREFYIGGGISLSRQQVQAFQGEVLLRDKNQQAFGAGVGITSELQPILSIKYYKKLGK